MLRARAFLYGTMVSLGSIMTGAGVNSLTGYAICDTCEANNPAFAFVGVTMFFLALLLFYAELKKNGRA